jgi:hypothetical protein
MQRNGGMSAINPASASDVTRLLGDVDPLIVERILETGASPSEIDEALQESLEDSGFGEESHQPSSQRVAEVRAVLDELVLPEDFEEEEEV